MTSQIKTDNHKMFIPRVMPVQFSPKKLLIDPYLLGLLLGDGSFSSSLSFATADMELVDYISSKLPPPMRIFPLTSKYSYSISRPRKGYGNTPNELQLKLEVLGLRHTRSHTKFIPDCYKQSSIEDRLAILRGLMDTDGCAPKIKATATFCSTSHQLAKDVREIVLSLGGFARLKYYKNSYSGYFLVHVQLEENPFSLKRKADRYGKRTNFHRRNVISIEKLDKKVEMACISVAAKDGLFVIKDSLLTHNTKPRMFYDLKTAANDDALLVQSKTIIQEMRMYDRNGLSELRAQEGMTKHFDLLTALAIAYQMRSHLLESTEVATVSSLSASNQTNSVSDPYASI